MEHNLVIEGYDFKLEVESVDFEFIAAIQAFVAEMVAEAEADYEILWDDEEEEEDEEDEE